MASAEVELSSCSAALKVSLRRCKLTWKFFSSVGTGVRFVGVRDLAGGGVDEAELSAAGGLQDGTRGG